ncbi:unnamed protein product, partial [Ectocarpus sp. 13 AM-2016]
AWEEGNWTGGGEENAPARGGRRLADVASIAPFEGRIVGALAAAGGWRPGAVEAALLEGAESPAAAARHSGGGRPPRVSAAPGTGSIEGKGKLGMIEDAGRRQQQRRRWRRRRRLVGREGKGGDESDTRRGDATRGSGSGGMGVQEDRGFVAGEEEGAPPRPLTRT